MAQFAHVGSAFAVTSPGATPNVNAFKQLLASGTSAIDSLDSQAPSEIASAFHIERVAYDQANAQAQSASTIADVGKVFASFGQPAVKSAASQVSAYISAKCGIAPGGATTPASTP